MYNLIYIHTHDSGRLFGVYGYDVPSNNLRSFADDAITFNNMYCVSPTCSPSRAALLTGLYPHQNGMLGLAQRGFSLCDIRKHLCQFLKRNHYHTVLSGVQHEIGFYLNIEDSDGLGYDEVITESINGYKKSDLFLWDKKNAENVCAWLTEYDSKKQNFFISFGMNGTHRPFPECIDDSINENYVKPCSPIYNNEVNRNDYAKYLTSAKYADECFGMVIAALKKTKHYDDTLIIFTTDHGVAMPFHKCTLSDKGIGVSMLMRVPDSVKKGISTDMLLSQIDVFPTLCDLMHLEKPDYLEGKSFAKLFTEGKEDADSEIFAEINFHTSYEPVRAIRTKRYKYIAYYDKYLNVNYSNLDASAVKDFYMENGLRQYQKQKEALYDLYYDPDEQNNLIDNENYREIVSGMKKRLSCFMIKTKDPLMNGDIPILSNYKVNKKDCLEASSKNPDDYEENGRFY